MVDPFINRRDLLAAAAGAPVIGKVYFVHDAAQLLPRGNWADPLLVLPLAADMRGHGRGVAPAVDGPHGVVSVVSKAGYRPLDPKTPPEDTDRPACRGCRHDSVLAQPTGIAGRFSAFHYVA